MASFARFSVSLIIFVSFVLYVHCDSGNGTVLHQWVQMDYDWEGMGEEKNEWIADGLFIAENCILAGIKQWKDTTFVTIPRWAPGVPATLNQVVERDGISLLLPFPPVSEQMINTTYGLKNVQSMEIDPLGRLWIIDTGALNFYFPDQYVWNTPRLLVYDLTSSPAQLIQKYSFPPDVAIPGQTFLNDIVIDIVNDFAFISNSVGSGGLFSYDLHQNEARFWNDPSTEVEPDGTAFDIQGSGNYTVITPSDGIALSANASTLYYCPLSGFNVYSIPTVLFRNFDASQEELHNSVVLHGQKNSQSDGIVIDSEDIMYFGDIGTNSISYWDTSVPLTKENQKLLTKDQEILQWQDTFGFDGKGSLLLITNRLQLFPTNYDFTGNSGFNFRILSFALGVSSYMEGNLKGSSPDYIRRVVK